MTNEQAKSELMQLYMMLSEEKKQALDVLMAQADGVCDNDCEHCIWTECPKDGDDYKYIKEISKPTGITFEQADRDLISKNNAITSICQWGTTLERTGTYTITVAEMKQTITDMLCELPSVDIPPEHNGCKDKVGHWIMPQQDDGMSDPIYYQVRCSKCGFDLDPQTWHQELHQYDADKFCPKCGCPMEIER